MNRLVHRLGFHCWMDYVDLYDDTSGQHCRPCGARRELVAIDDSPYGIRVYHAVWVVTRKSWEKEVRA